MKRIQHFADVPRARLRSADDVRRRGFGAMKELAAGGFLFINDAGDVAVVVSRNFTEQKDGALNGR